LTAPIAEPQSSAPVLTLALSGGGARAMAFHLGCLRALHDQGLLERVRVISTVSGGSVIGACYAYWPDDFAAFDRRMVKLLRRGLQRSILVSALFSWEALRILATLLVSGSLTLLLGGVRQVLKLTGVFGVPTRRLQTWTRRAAQALPVWGSLATAFEHALKRVLFGDVTLDAVARPGLEVIINACDLRTSTAFRFGSQASGGWRYGRIVDGTVTVAKAVASSAAYPLLLPPLVERFTFERNGIKQQHTVVLTDGGVFENLGVNVLEPGRNPDISVNTVTATHIISCNAGSGQLGGSAQPFWWPARVAQSFVTVHRKVQDATYGRLHRYVESGELDGFVMVYLGQDDDRLPVKPPDLVPRASVRDYPTDFAGMRGRDLVALADRGEQLTQHLIARYMSGLTV